MLVTILSDYIYILSKYPHRFGWDILSVDDCGSNLVIPYHTV